MAAMTALPQRLFKSTWTTLKILARNKAGFLGFVMFVSLLLMSFIGPLIVPPEVQADTTAINGSPTADHPLGTNFQGHDNLVMVVYGGREVLVVAFTAGILTVLIAISFGAFSAYLGGWVDTLLMSITDTWLTLPRAIILYVLATLVELDSINALGIFLALFSWPGLARQIRSQILSLKKREYVEAAVLLDLGTPHIVFREMLPSMMSFIAIALIDAMKVAIYQQVSLVFLGAVPFGSGWSTVFYSAYAKNAQYQADAAWSLIAPMGAIILFQLSLVLFSRSLEEVFNPRLRVGV
ncbi:Dipeptide transport system permease protein DppC [Thermoflexales bacterium]|nr:Dipeptide transport system permease protein DppC [Thermoflexales bacterium]